MSSPQSRAVVDFAVDYLSWKNKALSNTNLFVLAIVNHVWKMYMFCTDVFGGGFVL